MFNDMHGVMQTECVCISTVCIHWVDIHGLDSYSDSYLGFIMCMSCMLGVMW